jgi:trans-aconitate 2-methyltransferase
MSSLPLARAVEVWETIYHHVLEQHSDIIDWYRSTQLRFYLEALEKPGDQEEFLRDTLAACQALFPVRTDGRLLFPFRRLFVIAAK